MLLTGNYLRENIKHSKEIPETIAPRITKRIGKENIRGKLIAAFRHLNGYHV